MANGMQAVIEQLRGEKGGPGQGNIGFPPTFQAFILEQFKGLNTKARRPSIEDQECYWLENIMPIGQGNARAMYGVGDTLYTVPVNRTIVYMKAYNIGSTDYMGVFLDNGSAYQIRISDGTNTTISTVANRFYNGGDLPHLTQWGASGILIVSSAVADGYFAWDGTLYVPGAAAPAWLSGLDAPPTRVGNTNSSTTLTAFTDTVDIEAGMWVTGTDIPANTFVTGGTSTTVTIDQAATGTTVGVTFTFDWQMPTGVNGNGIETYQSRVFIIDGTNRLTSAANNGTYFAEANGGIIEKSTDSVLRTSYTAVQAANGFVYLLGDSSIFVIANVQSTTDTTTNFTTSTYQYSNVDPQTGTGFPESVEVFGRAIVFVNSNGVWALLGNNAQKISGPLDGIFETLDSSTVKPTVAVATIFGIRTLIVCLRAQDYLGDERNFLCLFAEGKWWVASQETVPSFIATQTTNSNLTAYGTNGTLIYPLFQTPSDTLTKTLQSKLFGGDYGALSYKQVLRMYLQMDPLGADPTEIAATVDTESSSVAVSGFGSTITFTNVTGGVLQFQNGSGGNLTWTVINLVTAIDAQNTGTLIGFTLTSSSADFVLERIGLGYRQETALY